MSEPLNTFWDTFSLFSLHLYVFGVSVFDMFRMSLETFLLGNNICKYEDVSLNRPSFLLNNENKSKYSNFAAMLVYIQILVTFIYNMYMSQDL